MARPLSFFAFKMSQKRLFLLDAYALIFRAYYALIKMPRITNAGFNTSAIFGFVNTLEELLRKENPTHIAVCFDPHGPTFRNEAYEQYKGERPSMPEDIRLSVPFIKEIIKAYNIPILEVEGFEADDVIGSMALKAEKEGFTTYMMTPDKDFGQLVTSNILQYKPSYRGQDFELRGEKEVCERYGIQSTSQIIDLLALMGDKVDNIPGCPGVGEKTAVKLIADFGSVDNLVAHTDSLKGALKKKIEDNREQIIFSKYLATIRTDVPLNEMPDDLVRCPEDRDRLFAIFKELEFKSLADRVRKRLDGASQSPIEKPAFPTSLFDMEESAERNEAAASTDAGELDCSGYEIIDSEDKLDKLRREIEMKPEVGVQMVTDGDNDMTARLIGVALSAVEGKGGFIPAGFKEGLDFVADLFSRDDIMKVSFDSKRDYVVAYNIFANKDCVLANWFDSTLAHYLLQPELRHDVSSLSINRLGIEMPESPLKGKTGKNLSAVLNNIGLLTPWACAAADICRRLRQPLLSEIDKEDMHALLFDIELPLVKVLAEMEIAGVRLDVDALNEAARAMEQSLSDIEKEIYELAGEEFNIGSPAKVGEILFDKLMLDPKAKKTKRGQYSTSEDVLEKIAHKNPIVALILRHRAMKKLLSTYLTALPAAINPVTGKVHTNYNQTVTATGRISSSNPNLQNIPVNDEEGREIRRAFIADKGHLFLSADYSQIELRLVADFANDETMLEAFREGRDIHTATAAKIYHKNPDEVSSTERRHAKTANFGILYGISAFGLAARLSIPRGEAKELIDNYFATFPTIRKYMSDAVENAREKGYVETIMGRRRQLPDINSRNPVVRGYAERNAVNAPIQGAAADIIKKAMVAIFREMEQKNLKSKMIMQVHDELNFDVIPDELPVMQDIVERNMRDAYKGKVVLTADSGVAENWLDAH